MSEKGGKRNSFIGKMLIFTANVVEILFLLSVWFVFTVSFFQILIKFEATSCSPFSTNCLQKIQQLVRKSLYV